MSCTHEKKELINAKVGVQAEVRHGTYRGFTDGLNSDVHCTEHHCEHVDGEGRCHQQCRQGQVQKVCACACT